MGQPGLILLDTHVLVWLASEPARLSRAAVDAIEDTRTRAEGLAVADITLWELTLLAGKGRIQLGTTLHDFFANIQERFVIRPITPQACLKTLNLPANYPKDPADRILAGLALAEQMALVTADEKIRACATGIRTIW